MKKYTLIATDKKTIATVIPERGAWVSSLILPFASGDRETLFQHDYANDAVIHDLPGGLPFLFPVCARLSREGEEGIYLYEGKRYHLPIHGFSWNSVWEVLETTKNSIELLLKDTDKTRKHYPFQFEVRLKYEVLPGKLLCYQTYHNKTDKRAMPYYAGFHPYFSVKGDKNKVQLDFESIKRLQYNAALTDIVGEKSKIETPVFLADPEINEQLSVLSGDKSAVLLFENNEKIKISVTDNPDYFPYLQLYHIPEKPFFCVEHWMGFPNAMNTVLGVRWLQPGESEKAIYIIESTS